MAADLWRNAYRLPGDGGPPDHEVGVQGDPDYTPKEGDREKFLSCKRGGRLGHGTERHFEHNI